MLTKKELNNIINSTILSSKPRKKYLDRIKPWLKRKEIIIIKGIRRCGKTHIMHQLRGALPKENTFYINFDDYRLDNYLTTELLEKILSLRNKGQRAYFFFDEIQQIQGFEKWLRTHYDKENQVKFVIGGSNISLLSPELSSVITGRNITFEIHPLDYEEFKAFCNGTLEQYMEFGGFPEIVLETDELKKRRLLEQYVTDIITKDIIDKYNIGNAAQLKALAKFFLNNPGIKISANKLGKQLGMSKNSAQKYIEYIADTFLIFEVPYFSYSAKTKYIGTHASKYYCMDNGLHTITTTKKNKGILFENAVAVKLRQKGNELFYWQDGAEIDFISDNKAIQATINAELNRETAAFSVFEKQHKKMKHLLVNPKKEREKADVTFVPIEKFLRE